MKHHLYRHLLCGALAALTGAGLASCEDFLNVKPRDIVTEDNFWNEQSDIDQFVAGCYTSMQAEAFISRCVVWGELRSDNLYPGSGVESGHYDLYQILRENILSTNQFTRWTDFYHVIDKCNSVIRMAPVVSQKDPAYRESDVRATIAEMTALRSLCYFYLIRAFDAVPFYREAIQQEDEVVYLPASGFDYILTQIIADLEAVKDDALLRYPTGGSDGVGLRYNSNCNRITRLGIYAMLADMYLWQGDYDKVAQYAEAIYTVKLQEYRELYGTQTGSRQAVAPKELNGIYGRTMPLYESTSQNPSASFDAIFGTGNSFESLFELSFNSTGEGSSYVKSTALGRLYGAGITKETDGLKPNNGAGFLTVNPSIVSEMASQTWSYFMNSRDVRYYNTFQTDNTHGEGTLRKGVASVFNLSPNTGSDADKVLFDNVSNYSFTIPGTMDRNWIFYRLTDVMLMHAEALLQLATDEDTPENTELLHQAFDLIYLVNRRSVVNSSFYLSFNSYRTRGLLQTLLREERNRELMFEGKRWFDLVRWARRDGRTDVVRGYVTAKISGGGAGSSRFASLETLYWPYNRDELKVDTLLHQKSVYATEAGEEYEMN